MTNTPATPACQSGACHQGRKPCPCPQACCVSEPTSSAYRAAVDQLFQASHAACPREPGHHPSPTARVLLRAAIGAVLIAAAMGLFSFAIVWAANA